jgi:site-specific recombinase XerD
MSPADNVFLRADNNRWGASHQKRPLDEASARAGISPAVTFHILRHTHGSHLAMNGVRWASSPPSSAMPTPA